MTAAQERAEVQMEKVRQASERTRCEIIDLLNNRDLLQPEGEQGARQVTVQTQKPVGNTHRQLQVPDEQLTFHPFSDTTRPPQPQNTDRWPMQTRATKSWDDIPSQSKSYHEGDRYGPVPMTSHYVMIEKLGPISEVRRALVDGKLEGNSRMVKEYNRHGR